MNKTTIFLSAIVLLACSSQTDKQSEGVTEQSTQKRITEGLPSGNWFYLPYTDSTIIKKSVFLYSQTCASYAYQISYDRNNPDSIRFIGYNEQATLPLIKKDEITYRAGDTVQHWVLKFNAGYTELKEFMDSKYSGKADPNAYKFILAEKEITSLSKHFVSNILKGTYKSGSMRIELTDNLIEKDPFTDYYEVTGFNGFRTYSIAINFWEMIPQMDLIYFYDKKGNVTYYNWTFENDELVLRNVQEILEDGDFAGGKATDVVYRLRKE